MILTVLVPPFEPPPELLADEELLPHAVALTAIAATASPAAALRNFDIGGLTFYGVGACLLERGVGVVGRAPGQEPALQQGDEELRDQRHHRDQEGPGVDAVGVEVALGLADEQAEPVLRADQLADDGADEREA